jgi:hypothetical protein
MCVSVADSSPSRFALLAIAGRSVTTSPGSQPGKGPKQCIMLRIAGRTLSRALHRSVPGRGLAPSPAPAAVASRRWFNAGGFHLAGHAGMCSDPSLPFLSPFCDCSGAFRSHFRVRDDA